MELAHKSKHGFTYLGMMVVLLIIGIVSALALMSVSHVARKQAAQEGVKEFNSLIQYASQTAITQQQIIGMVFYHHGYAFMRYIYKDNAWQWLNQDKQLQSHQLSNDIQIMLTVRDKPIELFNPTKPVRPQVIFTPGGDSTPFHVQFTMAGKTLFSYKHDGYGTQLQD